MGSTEKQKLVVKEIGLCTGNESMLNDENIFWKLIIYLKIVHLSISNHRYWFKNFIISFQYQLIVNIYNYYS